MGRRRRLVLSGDDRLGVHDEAEGEVVGEEGGERRHAAEGGAAGLEGDEEEGEAKLAHGEGVVCLRRIDQRHEEAEDLVQCTDAVGRAALRRLLLRRLRRRRNLGGRGRRRRRLGRRRRRRRGCRGRLGRRRRRLGRRRTPSPTLGLGLAGRRLGGGGRRGGVAQRRHLRRRRLGRRRHRLGGGGRGGGDGGGGGGDAADDGGLAERGELGDAREEAADDLAERRLRRVAEQLERLACDEMRKQRWTSSHTERSESAAPALQRTQPSRSWRMQLSTTSSAAGSVTSKRQYVAAFTTPPSPAASISRFSLAAPGLVGESRSACMNARTAHSARCVTTPLVCSQRMTSRNGPRYGMLSAPPRITASRAPLKLFSRSKSFCGGRYAAVWNERMSARSCVVTVDISESTVLIDAILER